ncbi:MAG TPA: replication initiator protein A [Gemmatimonadaceae bacterium]|nr:replication initiator protein A [Gemmatimonadaceae bacterium]
MSVVTRRRVAARIVRLDRSLEALPLFRLSDSADDAAITWSDDQGRRWRVIPSPGERLPGTFDQDVYVELLHRFHEAGEPADGAIRFTLHAFLRAMGRRVDGRTYEQLRGALGRLERTTLESQGAYVIAPSHTRPELRFSVLTSAVVERRRTLDREQLPLFPGITSGEPGVARVVLSSVIRENIAADHVVTLSAPFYWSLGSPVARRLYRLLEVARADGRLTWRIGLDELAQQFPLAQRYPSHLQRVLQPAHDMLVERGLLRAATIRQHQREWFVDYMLGSRPP